MQGMFSGAAEAKFFDRGQWFDPGFDGDVTILKTSAINSRDKGLMFCIEFEVATSNGHPKHPVGGKFVRFIKMQQNRETALAECKGIAGLAMGVDPNDPQYAQRLQELLDHSVVPQNETSNPLIGRHLHLMTSQQAKKRSAGNFTMHHWTPPTGAAGPAYNPAAHVQTQAPNGMQSQWPEQPPQAPPQWQPQPLQQAMPQAQPFPQQAPYGQPQWQPPQAQPQQQPQGPPNMAGQPFRWPGT